MDRDGLSWLHGEGQMVDSLQRELMVRVKLEARGQFGLYERLLSMKGVCLVGTYVIRHLVDVGGQGILYLAEDRYHPGTEVLIKMPFLPHHRPAYLDPSQIELARIGVLWEAYVLVRFRGTILPELYDFWYGMNPLYDPAWGKKITDNEPYLAMELISGLSLEDVIARLHTGIVQHELLEQVTWNVMYQVICLCETLWEDGGFLYTDLRPQNILLAGPNDRRGSTGWRRTFRKLETPPPPSKADTPVRVIDAGSVIRRRNASQDFPYHPAYSPPAFGRTGQEGSKDMPMPCPYFTIYTLCKTLVQVLTNHEPLPGRDPDLEEPILKHYSPALLGVLRSMILDNSLSFTDLKKAIWPYAEPVLWRGALPWAGL